MELSRDYTFRYHTPHVSSLGNWSLNRCELHLVGENVHLKMRIVLCQNRYRIMENPPEDPDDWDGNLGLKMEYR